MTHQAPEMPHPAKADPADAIVRFFDPMQDIPKTAKQDAAAPDALTQLYGYFEP